MDTLVRAIFFLSCTAPLVVVALRARRTGALGWWLAAAVMAAAAVFAHPLAVAFERVDGATLRAGCAS